MAIKITVEAPRGAGKSHLIGQLVPALQALGYGVTAFFSDRGVADAPSRNGGTRVVIIEVDDEATDISMRDDYPDGHLDA